MFVRFREYRQRLQVSLVETRRVGGKVRHEHVASLGSIDNPPSVADRIAFWQRVNDRLGKLSNRIDPATQGKVRGELHARVPMVTADDQRALQLENAEADERFWSSLESLHASSVEDQKVLAASVERAMTGSKDGAAEASANVAVARERIARIKKGEDVPGGLGKPRTREDFERILREAGVDPQHCVRMHEICEAFGDDAVTQAICDASERSRLKVVRDLHSLIEPDESR